MIVIGLLGPAGSGKSTVANHLIQKYDAARYSLAAPLKEIAARTLDFTKEQLYGTQEQKEQVDIRYGFSCRWFLQKLGTEGCRYVLGPDIWTKTCLSHINRDKPPIAVIDDARFINEAALIRAEPGGYVWRLTPPGDEEASVRAAAAGKHQSEVEWMHAVADLEIQPQKRGIPELLALVDAAMESLNLEPYR